MRGILLFVLTVFCINAFAQDTISGHVYADLNHNKAWEAGEPPITNYPLSINSFNSPIIFSDTNGYYIIYPFQYSTNPIAIKPDSLYASAGFQPDSLHISLTPFTNYINQDFALQFADTLSDIEVLATEVIRAIPGYNVEYNIAVRNKGTKTENGSLIFAFDPNFIYSTSTPGGAAGSDSVMWGFSNLLPSTSIYYTVVPSTKDSAITGSVLTIPPAYP